MGFFSRQECWSGLPCSSPRDLLNSGIKPRSPVMQEDSLPSEPPGKPKNTRVGGISLLQGIFQTRESNWGLLRCRQILYQLSHQGSPQSGIRFAKCFSILWLVFSLFCGSSFLFADGVVKGAGSGAKRETCEFSFGWGLIEGYSPGGSLSGSSEALLRRGGGRSQCVKDSGGGGTSNQARVSGESFC